MRTSAKEHEKEIVQNDDLILLEMRTSAKEHEKEIIQNDDWILLEMRTSAQEHEKEIVQNDDWMDRTAHHLRAKMGTIWNMVVGGYICRIVCGD
jgi:uncharacterized protein (DUF934 family)